MIYFAQPEDGGPIKIGTTKSLSSRIRQLNSTHRTRMVVLGVCDGDHAEERALHAKFRHLRYKQFREWFDAEPELLDFIKTNADPWEEEGTKSVSVNVPREVKVIALSLGMSVKQYVEDALFEAMKRDLPKAWEFIERRVKELASAKEGHDEHPGA